jgi:hypothetical protein
MDTAGDEFYVIDNSARFFGAAAWQASPTAFDRGFRGYAEFREAQFQSTELAAFDIVEMEQPVLGYIATLNEVLPRQTLKEYNIEIPSLIQLEQQGEGRDPQALRNPALPFRATDPAQMTEGGKIEGALIVWSIPEDNYVVASVPGSGGADVKLGRALTHIYAANGVIDDEVNPPVLVDGAIAAGFGDVQLLSTIQPPPGDPNPENFPVGWQDKTENSPPQLVVERWYNPFLDAVLRNSIVVGATFEDHTIIISASPTTLRRSFIPDA